MPHNSLRHLTLLLLAFAIVLTTLPPVQVLAAPHDIYTDGLAANWENYSWATVNLAATAPIHSGQASIAVTFGAYQGLYLHHPGITTTGLTTLRFFMHGGSAGGQRVQVYVTRGSDSGDQHGPEVSIAVPAANAWSEVQVPLADLKATGTTLTGITWQDRSGSSQPTLYIDDIALIGDESPDGPVLSNDTMRPAAAPADGTTGVVVQVQVADPQGASDITTVTVDASSLGRSILTLRDDGRSNDGASGDGIFGTVLTVAPGTAPGEYQIVASARDKAGHMSNLTLGAFVVLGTPGGTIPSSLPQRPAWGTNDWNENKAQDWQVQSGVPWDYVYQYITYEWYRDGWGGDFVGRFVRHAWDNKFVPVISVYLMLSTPPATGEGGAAYAAKLQNATTVSTYLAALTEAARQAKGDKPVIFQLEPDFYGFMQQLSNSPDRLAGVKQDDPSSYPVALNVPGYPNTLAGFGKRMVDVVHATAPNVLVAPHASMWATNRDPNNGTPVEAQQMAERTATFIDAMGGTQADLLFAEWSDRDAGSGLRPFWDDTNHALPHVNRAVLWENALSAASKKRLILWQIPVGNMSLDNTCDHYKDNRAAYAFRHPRDLFDAGVMAMLFGGGASCMTSPHTDGGFVASQGAIAYATPATPTGLSGPSVVSSTVALHWNDSDAPDHWGYRLNFQSTDANATSSAQTLDVGPGNTTTLLLPHPGDWQVSVMAYDAMGNISPASAPITVQSTTAVRQVLLPVVMR